VDWHWQGSLAGSIMVLIGLIVVLCCVPLISCWLAKQEKKKLTLPLLADYANKSAYLLVIVGSLIILITWIAYASQQIGIFPN